jgi:rfaE bifunctional protein nucleotidyltransferase chain/domain
MINLPLRQKVLTYQSAIDKIQKEKSKGLKVVLAQGVFDIVHIGHIKYLREAKKAGDVLFVGVENDKSVNLNKGQGRPFNKLTHRLKFLSELELVDYVFGFKDNPKYDSPTAFSSYIKRYSDLKPNFLAVASWDPNLKLKQHQANVANIQLTLTNEPKTNSTTRLLKMIGYE